MVNTAFDSPIDVDAARPDRGGRAEALRDRRDRQIRPGFEPFSSALTDAIDMAANAYRRDGGLSGLATGFSDLDATHGRLAALRPDHPRRPPGDGQDRARHQHRLSRGARNIAPDRPTAEHALDGAVVGFFSLEMSAEQLATRIISEQAYIPSERIRRGRIDADEFDRIVEVVAGAPEPAALYRPDRRHHGRASSPRARGG